MVFISCVIFVVGTQVVKRGLRAVSYVKEGFSFSSVILISLPFFHEQV